MRTAFSEIVLCGTGGASLGAQALCAMETCSAFTRHHNRVGISWRPLTRTASPVYCATLDPERTGFLFVSKSGETIETLAQILAIIPWLTEELDVERVRKRCLVITGSELSTLRRIATRLDLPIFTHPDVSGRFSGLGPVGMIPAKISGLDVDAAQRAMHTGYTDFMTTTRLETHPVVLGAGVVLACITEGGAVNHVIMAYCDRLQALSRWIAQLSAESLGKSGNGQFPILASGPADQHSQMQLWLDGPPHAVFTLLAGTVREPQTALDQELASVCGVEWLANTGLAKILNSAITAAAKTLAASGRGVRIFHLADVTIVGLCEVMLHFCLETVLIAEVLGLNAFDQPAVEQIKECWRSLLDEGDSP